MLDLQEEPDWLLLQADQMLSPPQVLQGQQPEEMLLPVVLYLLIQIAGRQTGILVIAKMITMEIQEVELVTLPQQHLPQEM